MKILAVFLILVAITTSKNVDLEYNSVNQYHRNIGIPLANSIRAAEDQAQSRIVGGFPASLGQFPYQAGIIIDLLSRHQSVCGGAIISTWRVLTAAHCWWTRNDQGYRLTVVAGAITLFTGGQRRITSSVIMHGDYNPDTNQNNIAMVYVLTAFTTSANLAAASLPIADEIQEDFLGAIATVSGYGLRRDDSVMNPDQFLSFANVHVVNNSFCAKAFFPNAIGESHICTHGGVNNGSVCIGDEGSPLVVIRETRRILAGITSFVPSRGCQLHYPNGFSRITYYMDWLARLPTTVL